MRIPSIRAFTLALSCGLASATSSGADILLTGKTVDAQGRPVAKVMVWSLAPDGGIRRTSSGPGGEYALTKVPEDRLGLWAGSRQHMLQAIEAPSKGEGGVRQLDIVVEPKPQIAIYLRSKSGAPALPALWADEVITPYLAKELEVVATAAAPDLAQAGQRAENTQGFFQLSPRSTDDDAPWATVTLHRRATTFVSLVAFQQTLATQEVEAGTESIAFTLEPEDLRELLVDIRVRFVHHEDGEAVTGSVRLQDAPRIFGREDMVETDADGVLELKQQAPGTRWLFLRPGRVVGKGAASNPFGSGSQGGRAPEELRAMRSRSRRRGSGNMQALPVQLKPGVAHDLGDIQVGLHRWAHGMAFDETHTPRATAISLWRIAADGSLEKIDDVRHITSADHGFSLRADEAGEYLAEVTGFIDREDPSAPVWCGPPQRLDLRTDSIKDLEFSVRRAEHLVVTSPERAGGLSSGARFQFYDSSGALRHPARTTTGAYLEPGRYTVTHERGAEVLESQTVVVGPNSKPVIFSKVP